MREVLKLGQDNTLKDLTTFYGAIADLLQAQRFQARCRLGDFASKADELVSHLVGDLLHLSHAEVL